MRIAWSYLLWWFFLKQLFYYYITNLRINQVFQGDLQQMLKKLRHQLFMIVHFYFPQNRHFYCIIYKKALLGIGGYIFIYRIGWSCIIISEGLIVGGRRSIGVFSKSHIRKNRFFFTDDKWCVGHLYRLARRDLSEK